MTLDTNLDTELDKSNALFALFLMDRLIGSQHLPG
jgi:hypothetical protein